MDPNRLGQLANTTERIVIERKRSKLKNLKHRKPKRFSIKFKSLTSYAENDYYSNFQRKYAVQKSCVFTRQKILEIVRIENLFHVPHVVRRQSSQMPVTNGKTATNHQNFAEMRGLHLCVFIQQRQLLNSRVQFNSECSSKQRKTLVSVYFLFRTPFNYV